jgi:hypothetical protein
VLGSGAGLEDGLFAGSSGVVDSGFVDLPSCLGGGFSRSESGAEDFDWGSAEAEEVC